MVVAVVTGTAVVAVDAADMVTVDVAAMTVATHRPIAAMTVMDSLLADVAVDVMTAVVHLLAVEEEEVEVDAVVAIAMTKLAQEQW